MKLTAEELLFAATQEDSLRELVGTQVFPGVAPTGTTAPWATYSRVSLSELTSHDGFDEVSEPVYQVTAWASDAKTRRDLRQALLATFRLRRATFEGTDVVFNVLGDRDLQDDGPPELFGVALDISVSH